VKGKEEMSFDRPYDNVVLIGREKNDREIRKNWI